MDPRMLAIGGNIIGGYLLGNQQREIRLEDQKHRQQQLKIMMDAQKIKDAKEERAAAAEERKQQLLMQIFGADLTPQQAEGGADTPSSGLRFGNTFGGDSSASTQPKPRGQLVDILSDPLKAAVAKEITGVDFLGALNSNRQNMQAQLDVGRFEREGSQGAWVDMPDGKGGMVKMWQPRFGGPGGGGVSGGYQPPKPELRQFEQGGVTYERSVNPYTQQPMGDVTIKQEVKPASVDTAGKIALANQALQHMGSLKSMILDNDGTVNRKMIMAASVPGGGIGRGREIYAKFLDALDARKRSASGSALTKEEETNYARMYWPSILDDDKLIKDKLTRLEGFLNDYAKSLDPTGSARERLNTKESLPKQAVTKLKEGVITTFGNGQKWTLKNGVPEQVK